MVVGVGRIAIGGTTHARSGGEEKAIGQGEDVEGLEPVSIVRVVDKMGRRRSNGMEVGGERAGWDEVMVGATVKVGRGDC